MWGHHWFQLRWPPSYATVTCTIVPKELVSVVMACAVWGWHSRGKVVHVHSDNEAVVASANVGYSKDPQMMHLIRCLFFILAAWSISLYACHFSGGC